MTDLDITAIREEIAQTILKFFNPDPNGGSWKLKPYDAADALLAGPFAASRAVVERLQERERAFSETLGFGDGKTEPAATLEEMTEYIQSAFEVAKDHDECPVICENCGEKLAATVCAECRGAGGSLISGGYSECGNCGGDRKVHDGCVSRSYTDLADQVERLQGELDAQTVEWGVRHDGDYGVIPAPGIEYAERMVRIAPRHTAVSRKVGPWLPVPTDGAEKTFAWAEKYAPDWVARAKRKAEAAEN